MKKIALALLLLLSAAHRTSGRRRLKLAPIRHGRRLEAGRRRAAARAALRAAAKRDVMSITVLSGLIERLNHAAGGQNIASRHRHLGYLHQRRSG